MFFLCFSHLCAGVDDDIRRAMELSRQEQGLPPSADFMSDEDQIKQAINLSLQEQNQGDSSSSSTTSSMYPQSPPPPSSSSSRAAAAPSSLPAASASMSDDEAEMARAIAMSLQDVDSPPSSSSSSSGARPVASSHPFSSAGHSLSSSSSSKPKQNVDAVRFETNHISVHIFCVLVLHLHALSLQDGDSPPSCC